MFRVSLGQPRPRCCCVRKNPSNQTGLATRSPPAPKKAEAEEDMFARFDSTAPLAPASAVRLNGSSRLAMATATSAIAARSLASAVRTSGSCRTTSEAWRLQFLSTSSRFSRDGNVCSTCASAASWVAISAKVTCPAPNCSVSRPRASFCRCYGVSGDENRVNRQTVNRAMASIGAWSEPMEPPPKCTSRNSISRLTT